MSRMKYLGIFSRDIFWKERNVVNTYIYLNKRRILIKGSDVTSVCLYTKFGSVAPSRNDQNFNWK